MSFCTSTDGNHTEGNHFPQQVTNGIWPEWNCKCSML